MYIMLTHDQDGFRSYTVMDASGGYVRAYSWESDAKKFIRDYEAGTGEGWIN